MLHPLSEYQHDIFIRENQEDGVLDRDKQFQHINSMCKIFEENRSPIISIDCKKKEQIGNFKNNGREWTKSGKENETKVYTLPFVKDQ
jgi:Rhodopirellula transposase DDE domain